MYVLILEIQLSAPTRKEQNTAISYGRMVSTSLGLEGIQNC